MRRTCRHIHHMTMMARAHVTVTFFKFKLLNLWLPQVASGRWRARPRDVPTQSEARSEPHAIELLGHLQQHDAALTYCRVWRQVILYSMTQQAYDCKCAPLATA